MTPPPRPPLGHRPSASTAVDRVSDRGARAAHRRAGEPIRREGGVRAARRALGDADAAVAPTDAVAQERRSRPHVPKMRPDGTLDWTPPAGQWVVLRMGYSLLGITNHPASPEGTGLEVDKLNPRAREGLHGRVSGQLQERRRALMGARGLRFLISDSWEAGAQNWTDRMIAEFTTTPRLRSAAVAAGADRPRRGKRGGRANASSGISGERSRTCSRSITTTRSPRS